MKGAAWEGRFILWSVLALFVVLKTRRFDFNAGDENIYFYLADQVSGGALPYRDFFHAHPPFHLTALSLINWAGGGFSLVSARLLSLGATIGAALMLARLAPSLGARAAICGSAIYLLSFDVLRLSTFSLGANLATFWVAVGLERLSRQKDRQAAMAFCCGGFTLLNVAPAAIGATLVLLLANPGRGARLVRDGAIGIVALNAGAFALFGYPYLDQVYLFHLGKSVVGSTTLDAFIAVVQHNGLLVATASMGSIALMLGVESKSGDELDPTANPRAASALVRTRAELNRNLTLYLSLGAALASILFLALVNRVFIYYFQVLLLCLAPVAGHGVAAFVDSARKAFDGASSKHAAGEARLAFAVMLLLFVAGQLPSLRTSEGVNITSVGQYLAGDADWFASAEPLARHVSAQCGEEETVFGDSTAAPLVALLAERKLSLGEADTNQMRFKRKPGASKDFISRLEEDPPCAVVDRERHGVLGTTEFAAWLEHNYLTSFSTSDPLDKRHFRIWIRKPDGAPPS